MTFYTCLLCGVVLQWCAWFSRLLVTGKRGHERYSTRGLSAATFRSSSTHAAPLNVTIRLSKLRTLSLLTYRKDEVIWLESQWRRCGTHWRRMVTSPTGFSNATTTRELRLKGPSHCVRHCTTSYAVWTPLNLWFHSCRFRCNSWPTVLTRASVPLLRHL